MIDCKVFKPKTSEGQGAIVEALKELNDWKSKNAALRVLNVETLMDAKGGESVYGNAVRLYAVGLRVWFEASA